MGKENERKYLLREEGIYHTSPALRVIIPDQDLAQRIDREGVLIVQGYIAIEEGLKIGNVLNIPRFNANTARLRQMGDLYFFALKGKGDETRDEEEREISRSLFAEYWGLTAGRRVTKKRLKLPWQEWTAELDLFLDRDLILAEVEVPCTDDLTRIIAPGLDVSKDKKYKNNNLAR